MASVAQIEANRLNAAASCGPKTPTGKARSSRNHLKFGLFSTENYVRPEETAEYTKLSKALWKDLNPVGPVEQMLAVEIIRVSWRLQRCAVAEAEDGANPPTQAAVDRARASAHNSLRHMLNELRQFQSDRWLRAEVLRDGFDEDHIGIADAHRVIKALAANERLKTQFFTAPIGIDPLNAVGQDSWPVDSPPAPTIRTQSAGEVGQAPRFAGPSRISPANKVDHTVPVAPAVSAGERPAPAIRTQSVAPLNVPRNAPCPCHSGLKYKRCCGATAPPVLGSQPHSSDSACSLR